MYDATVSMELNKTKAACMSAPASGGIKMSHRYRLGKAAIGEIMRYQKPPFKRSTAHKSTPTTKRVKKPHRCKLFPSLT